MNAPKKNPATTPSKLTMSQIFLLTSMPEMTPSRRARHMIIAQPAPLFIHSIAMPNETMRPMTKMATIAAVTYGNCLVPKRAIRGPAIR